MDTALERVRGKAATYGRNVLLATGTPAYKVIGRLETQMSKSHFAI